ncbi:putative 1-phosphatidylinositol phosphodiesterase precursor [Podospora australis]|uniref:1-phosphatidylinositol phosphodiesterase n=1 Tax=Podospora australis TaxID=1536484 RepID=A0AAN6X5P8_9PEZI|nr:putative 1-phosphatidylinositol phosphodiesterase precursor [Podospora australis]
MGVGHSRHHKVAAAAAAMPETITIRNLTITPLELKLVERLDPPQDYGDPIGFTNITARFTGGQQQANGTASAPEPTPSTSNGEETTLRRPSASQQLHGISLPPFSERPTNVYPPDLSRRGEQIRLTFQEPGTNHRYAAEIPGPSPKSIVLKPVGGDSPADNGKEFTAIYLPSQAYLALFSSADLSSWMNHIGSSLPLSSLSIPGTHNSPTCYVALPSVRCQAVSVTEQLLNGVRFLDVRVNVPEHAQHTSQPPDLALVHSAFPIALSGPKYFHHLLDKVYAFLETHPSETVLMSIKREGTGKGTDQHLSKILRKHYVSDERWHYHHARGKIPTLGEVRGKIVLVRRFHLPHPDEDQDRLFDQGFGIDGSHWPDNVADGICGSGQIRIQDYYGVQAADEIETKIRYAQEELQRSAEQVLRLPVHRRGPRSESSRPGSRTGPTTATTAEVVQRSRRRSSSGDGRNKQHDPLPLFINFLSASNFFNANCWPDRIATRINPQMIEYLCHSHGAEGKGSLKAPVGDAATGIVVTDWVGHNGDWDLVRCIVGWNARLQLKV